MVQNDCWRLFVAIDNSYWSSTLTAFVVMFWEPKPSYSACTHDLRSQASKRIQQVVKTKLSVKKLWLVPKHRQKGRMNILRAPMKTNDSETPAGLELPQWFNVWLNTLEMGQVYSAIATTCCEALIITHHYQPPLWMRNLLKQVYPAR